MSEGLQRTTPREGLPRAGNEQVSRKHIYRIGTYLAQLLWELCFSKPHPLSGTVRNALFIQMYKRNTRNCTFTLDDDATKAAPKQPQNTATKKKGGRKEKKRRLTTCLGPRDNKTQFCWGRTLSAPALPKQN